MNEASRRTFFMDQREVQAHWSVRVEAMRPADWRMRERE
jgi:hypothetical protein